MTFSPSQNSSQNFRQRYESMRALLVQEGLSNPPGHGGITTLFGYEGAIQEETFTGVVTQCVAMGRADLVPTLIDYLSERELGRLGPTFLQIRSDEALAHVLPRLASHHMLSLLSACLVQRRDDAFDLFKPFLSPAMATTTLIMTAAANDVPTFGAYFIENGDVLQALRDIKSPSVANQVAAWWVEAIQEQRVALPELGRAKKHWCKKFPVLGSVMRTDELERSFSQSSAPTVRRPRF